MSLFSTNTVRNERSGVESYSLTQLRKASDINLNPGRLFVQRPPKKGKGIEKLI